jgi:hypothetical protein
MRGPNRPQAAPKANWYVVAGTSVYHLLFAASGFIVTDGNWLVKGLFNNPPSLCLEQITFDFLVNWCYFSNSIKFLIISDPNL